MIEDIRFREVELFLKLLKLKSIREVARQTSMQPGQVSKWIAALETKLNAILLDRSAGGVRPTARALELVPVFEKMMNLQEKLRPESDTHKTTQYSFASSSFFSTHLVPLILKGMPENAKVKLLDLAPTNFVPAGLRGAFEFCLHSQKLDWPQTWTTVEVGHIRWNLYARKKHPLLKNPNMKDVLNYPFVVPIYWTQDGTQYGDDQCPIPMSKRLKGHETATAASACEIVKVTDQLAFLPEIVAGRGEYALASVKMPWKDIKRPVFLSVKNSSVKQHEFERIASVCKDILKSLDAKH